MLSVIIVNFNSGGLLVRCLDSLCQNLAMVDHEVCIVDNASTDGSAEEAARFSDVVLVQLPTNGGFSHGVNVGLARTRGEVVMWLNPDTELLDPGIGELVSRLDRDPRVGILGPQIVSPDGGVQLSCRSWPTYKTALFNRYSLLTRLFPDNPHSREYLELNWDHASAKEVDWVSGCCLVHRRRVAEEIGGLDEAFFMYCEDVDFCRRARSAGWLTLYEPAMRVLHHIAGSTRSERRRMIIERHRSMWRYYRKHFEDGVPRSVAVRAGIGGRATLKILGSLLSRRALP
jgi:N-acetylglucosaminyl-diphospho-decaprenol L-rhamnosyltransferase